MLEKLMKEMPNMKLRLMGLRVTHIISTKKPGIDFFGRSRLSGNTSTKKRVNRTGGEWEIWPEQDFEEAAARERNDEMNELEQLSQEYERAQTREDTGTNVTPQSEPVAEEQWTCPICALPQAPDDSTFNAHIDFCLSRDTIKEAVKSTAPTPPPPVFDRQPSVLKQMQKKGKRGRSKNEPPAAEELAREKRKAFFFAGGS
jgi:DNA polymerase kappa